MPATTKSAFEAVLRSISRGLCEALDSVLTESVSATAGTHQLRPVLLTKHLGLNKSLASRIARALRERDELKALYGVPTPQGLELVHRAGVEHGASTESLKRLRIASEAYGELLAGFSGGRTDLEAALAGWIPEQRARSERDARRLIFRGMTTFEGTRTGVAYNSVYLLPSKTEADRLDVLVVTVREDVRRLRLDEPLPLFQVDASSHGEDWRVNRTRLDGSRFDDSLGLQADPRSLLLEELCSTPLPRLEIQPVDRALSVRIAEDALDVNQLATLAFGWRMPALFPRFDETGAPYHHMCFAASKPSESMVVDLFVHNDASLPSPPVASINRETTWDHSLLKSPPPLESRARKSAPDVHALRSGRGGLKGADAQCAEGAAKLVSAQAGLDLADFTTYRTRIEFPMANEELTLWWPIQNRPGPSEHE